MGASKISVEIIIKQRYGDWDDFRHCLTRDVCTQYEENESPIGHADDLFFQIRDQLENSYGEGVKKRRMERIARGKERRKSQRLAKFDLAAYLNPTITVEIQLSRSEVAALGDIYHREAMADPPNQEALAALGRIADLILKFPDPKPQ